MNIIKKFLLNIGLASLLLAPLALVGGTVAAQTPNVQESVKQGTCLTTGNGNQIADGSCAAVEEGDGSKVNKLVATVINVFSWVVGVISVIMIIYGGFKYITSGGDAGGVTAAKNTILYAIVGLIIVALAQVIVQFVLSKV